MLERGNRIRIPHVAFTTEAQRILAARIEGVFEIQGVTERQPMALDRFGRGQIRRAVVALFEKAQERRLIVEGDADTIADAFCSVLLSDVIMRLILGVARKPTAKEMTHRARLATELSLEFYAARAARQKSPTG